MLTSQVSNVVEDGLRRFRERITRVEVHLSDENSNKKGGNEDKRCLMEVRLDGYHPIVVTHYAGSLDQWELERYLTKSSRA